MQAWQVEAWGTEAGRAEAGEQTEVGEHCSLGSWERGELT